MKVLYVCLTCDAYISTRAAWQRATWLPHVTNFVFLGATMRPEIQMVGWDTADDHGSCPMKIYQFMLNSSLEEYDWVVFVDDDTFVYPQRLEPYLEALDVTKPLYVGALCNDEWVYMSGGAGFAVSAPLVRRIQTYLQTTPMENVTLSSWSDHSFGAWVHATEGVRVFLEDSRFHGDYRSEYAPTCFTCHYVTEEGFYELAKNLP